MTVRTEMLSVSEARAAIRLAEAPREQQLPDSREVALPDQQVEVAHGPHGVLAVKTLGDRRAPERHAREPRLRKCDQLTPECG